MWTKTTFRRPKTLAQKRNPKNKLRAVSKLRTTAFLDVIKNPMSSESAIKNIEDNNTLVFVVNKRSNKKMIKQSIEQLYKIKIKKVNTLITPKGLKKAYVKLTSD